MSTRPRLLHLLLIGLGLVLLAAGALYYTNATEPVEGLTALAEPQTLKTPDTAEACAAAGGVWNECASPCPPDAQACAQVCVRKCEGVDDGKKIVDVYFPNSTFDPKHLDCSKVFPVKRAIDPTQDSPDAFEYRVLKALLAGPSAAEKAAGYFSTIPEDVTVVREFHGATFQVDFSKELAKVAGSCRVSAIRSQVETTLMSAFPDVKKVVIGVEGLRPAESLQP